MSNDNSPLLNGTPRSRDRQTPVLDMVRSQFRQIAEKEGMLNVEITVLTKTLTPEEAIGNPDRRDFPIIVGKERVIEASMLDAKGHAFTDSPQDFHGTLAEVLSLELNTNQHRAIFIATLNAALRHLDIVKGTVHCKDEDPEKCAREIAETVLKKHGKSKVGLIGLNPAIAERLADTFGADHVFITDLNAEIIGTSKFGVEVWDGAKRTADLVDTADVIVLTGTTLVNGTFDEILRRIKACGKNYLVYGVTTAGVSELAGFERICPYGQDA